MRESGLFFKVGRWAAGAVIVSLTATLVQPARVAEARQLSASCRHTNRVSSSMQIGSQVDGSLVIICLSKSQLRFLHSKPSAIPKAPAPKTQRTNPPRPKPRSKPPANSKSGGAKLGTVKTSRPSANARRSSGGNNGVFQPRVDPLIAKPTVLDLGQRVTFTTNQQTRLGRAKLLGKPVTVKFVPSGLQIDFGDATRLSSKGADSAVQHLYVNQGSYRVLLEVTYRVFYRVEGGRWFRDPESITLPADPVTVIVGLANQPGNKLNVVLVSPIG